MRVFMSILFKNVGVDYLAEKILSAQQRIYLVTPCVCITIRNALLDVSSHIPSENIHITINDDYAMPIGFQYGVASSHLKNDYDIIGMLHFMGLSINVHPGLAIGYLVVDNYYCLIFNPQELRRSIDAEFGASAPVYCVTAMELTGSDADHLALLHTEFSPLHEDMDAGLGDFYYRGVNQHCGLVDDEYLSRLQAIAD